MREDQEIRQLKEELQQAREMLFQTAKLAEMGKLVAVVAHELSQPLLGIKAFAQILRRRFKTDEFIGPKVRMIEEQAVHMENILGTLRRASRMPHTAKGEVAPREAVDIALELFEERAKKLRIRIELQAAENLPRVRLTRGHLQQVVVNLLSNALDELEGTQEGLVLVRLELQEGGVRLWVADTGRGVPDQARAQLFEPFFSTKGVEKGTGLGLSICRDILELNGGSIRLMEASEVQEVFGSEFATAFELSLAEAVVEADESE